MLAVGHAAEPQSIYNNTALYPSMFPWLFPYGLGGLGSGRLSEVAHKKWLLMYHNKRFQNDIGFPFVAFSHEQVKTSTTGGFLLTDKDKFFEISERIHKIDDSVLRNTSEKTLLLHISHSDIHSICITSNSGRGCTVIGSGRLHPVYAAGNYVHTSIFE